MGRTTGRTPEDTRRLLLTAAGQMLREKGAATTLDDIAHHAGVSKGGLIYHFPGKDELFLALAQDLLDEFRSRIEDAIDPADTAPGRFTRGYLRVLLAPHPDEAAARESIALITQLFTLPAVADLARADADDLDARLRGDGLPDDVLVLIASAADGANAAPGWGGRVRPTAELDALLTRLTRLTREPELWQNLPW